MSHVKVLGMKLKLLSVIGNGTYLVAHPNGPAITNGDSICTLDYNADTDQRTPRDKAILDYVQLSWPIVRSAMQGDAPDVGGHPKLP